MSAKDEVVQCDFCPFEGWAVVTFEPGEDPDGRYWDCPECEQTNRIDVSWRDDDA